eukprot:653716-Rhodomonas_salina.2
MRIGAVWRCAWGKELRRYAEERQADRHDNACACTDSSNLVALSGALVFDLRRMLRWGGCRSSCR